MAKSKFLKLQDKNGDGLIDECGDQPFVPEIKKCPDCVPNSSAPVPPWKKQGNNQPWLNEKECLYQVTITTSATQTAPSGATDKEANEWMNELFDSYKETAIESLLVNFDKKETPEAHHTLDTVIQYTRYDLDVRPGARVKLLYSVDAAYFDALEDTDGTEEEEDEDALAPSTTVTLKTSSLALKLMRIRKTLHLYNRYYTIHQYLRGGTIVLGDQGSIFNLADYGDNGVWGNSITSKLLPQLDYFLNQNGLDIPKSSSGTLGSSFLAKDVFKLELAFGPDYKLEKISAYVKGCAEPTVFNKKKLKRLIDSPDSVWKDRTAVAYFTQVEQMHQAITSRTPMPWIDFLIAFTYPSVEERFNYRAEEPEAGDGGGPLTCVADALKREGKQLGLDILNEALGIGDAIAYQFHKNACKNLEEKTDEDVRLGLKPWYEQQQAMGREGRQAQRKARRSAFVDAVGTVQNPDDPSKTQSLGAFAKEQAFKDVPTDQLSFERICADWWTGAESGNASFEDIFEVSFDRMKVCGLQALLLDTVQCLMGGLELEEALARITKAALKGMSIENFGILFVGLPSDVQARLDQQVKEKLASGEFFKNESENQRVSDEIAGDVPIERPWILPAGGGFHKSYGRGLSRKRGVDDSPEADAPKRSIAQQFDLQNQRKRLNSDVLFEAYIGALIEEYSDNLLDLVDKLNEFPGAPIIANFIATMNCPTSPIFDPSVMDFIKDVELPFCRSANEITIPALNNPGGWIPSKNDVLTALFDGVTKALQDAIIKMMMKFMTKTCQVFGDAICESLERMGELAVDIAQGENSFANLIRNNICGPHENNQASPSDEEVNATINDIMNSLGPGGAAMANADDSVGFTAAVAGSTTKSELTNAMLGNCSPEFITIVDTLIEYEYPQFREGLPTGAAICRFFTNVGNLMPVEARDEMKNMVQDPGLDQQEPANPSLCLTPEQKEEFCTLRSELLEGRATPTQIKEMCDNAQEEIADALEETAGAAQGDPFDQMPPIVSEPGCNNGLIPFESEAAIATATANIGDALEQLKLQYVEDMLGNGGFGPFASDEDWGMFNLILSDTEGNPITVHNRRSARIMGGSMDAITNEKMNWADWAGLIGGVAVNPAFLLLFFAKPMPTMFQHSALPTKVADWLQEGLRNNSSPLGDGRVTWWNTFSSTNDWAPPTGSNYSFEELGFTGFFGDDVDLTQISEVTLGYNIELQPHFGATLSLGGAEVPPNDSVTALRKGRKATPDVILKFRDHNKGLQQQKSATWDYGFNTELYLSDLQERGPTLTDKPQNVPSNNCRVLINDALNSTSPDGFPPIWSLFASTAAFIAMAIEEGLDRGREPIEVVDLKYEFFAVDDTFDNIKLSNYPKLLAAYDDYNPDYAPQIILLQELIEQANPNFQVNLESLKTVYDDVNNELLAKIREAVHTNEEAFDFGVDYGDLTYMDFEYVMPYEEGQTEPIPYDQERGERILGISRNQWEAENAGTPEETRVFYLSPIMHKGSYKDPPLYVKAAKRKGWMGFLDAMFPDFSVCPDAPTDFVNFDPIQERVDSTYANIPEDQRLKYEPQCVEELPYFRVLERPAVAGLEALISATIQIFVTTHMVKSMPVFTYFKPSFADNYSRIYTSYIVEMMESALKDAQGPFKEFFNTFKDNEFWYAFLEQSVQLYGRLVDEGQLRAPPPHIQQAITRLNDMQQVYEYPTKQDLYNAILIGEEPWYQIFNLPGYRSEKNLEAVQATEEDAKMILSELVGREINLMAEKYNQNLESIDAAPRYDKIGYWFLSTLVGGGEALKLTGQLKESIENSDLETRTPDNARYTNGGELFVKSALSPEGLFEDGDDYVGFYHVHTTPEGEKSFMAGKEHIEGPHDLLGVYVNKIKMKDANGDLIGDISGLGSAYTAGRAFAIEKYVSIDGEKLDPTEAMTRISQHDAQANISDVYPGTLRVLEKPTPEVTNTSQLGPPPPPPGSDEVGLAGQLGVRHGLQFYCIVDGHKAILTNVEVDALDTAIGDFSIAESSSKLLLCLINNLLEDEKFKMITEYIYPLNKYSSLAAIYTDLAFFPSIGEKIYDPVEIPNQIDLDTGNVSDYAMGWDSKAGLHFDTEKYAADMESYLQGTGPLPADLSVYYDNGDFDGWSTYMSRRPNPLSWLLGITEWDNWDQVILRKSKSTIKHLFKTYYFARDFKPGDPLTEERPSKSRVRTLKSFYLPPAGGSSLSARKRKKLRPNPFGNSGKECKKKDE